MAQRHRRRGFLASDAGLRKLEARMVEQRYSQEHLAEEANVRIDQVKRLLNPHWGYKIQRDAICKIAGILGLRPTDIVEPNDWNPLSQSKVGETIPKTIEDDRVSARVFISYRSHDPDKWLAQQFYKALEADGHEVLMTLEIPPVAQRLQYIRALA